MIFRRTEAIEDGVGARKFHHAVTARLKPLRTSRCMTCCEQRFIASYDKERKKTKENTPWQKPSPISLSSGSLIGVSIRFFGFPGDGVRWC
jgi:hypothetical protein